MPERFLCQDGVCWITPEHAATRRRERRPELTLDPTLLYTPLDFGRDGRNWLLDALAPTSFRDLGNIAVRAPSGVSVDLGGAAVTLLLGPYGAPATVATLETAIALGTRRILFLGICGSLQPDLRIGDFVLADRAIREEGTSYHYLPSDAPAEPTPRLLDAAEARLAGAGVRYRRGALWTTDAPYRETHTKVRRLAGEGILGVEMETSAVYALASVRGVDALSFQVVSDQLVGDEWTGIHRESFLDRCDEAARLLADLATAFAD
jgi:uridine phosphorylase